MPISELELADLKSRTANAIRTNSAIANVQGHIDTLKAMIGKPELAKAGESPTRYLYRLILQAETTEAEIPETTPTPEPTPLPEPLPEPEPIPEPIPEPLPEPELTEEVIEETLELVEEAPVKAKESSEKPKGKKDKKKSQLN